MVEIEIYDDGAAGQNSTGAWPTKKIRVSKAWLDQYARSYTRYRSGEELLKNYTLDEVDGLEEAARKAKAIRQQKKSGRAALGRTEKLSSRFSVMGSV